MTQDFTKINSRSASVAQASDVDQGLRSYMLGVYNYMAGALALTGIVAYLFYASGMFVYVATNMPILTYGIMFAPLGMALFMMVRMHKLSLAGAQTTFWIYATVIGLSLSSVFMVYTSMSIAKAFFMTSGIFAAMSLYGYTTKKDLTKLGSMLMIGFFAVLVVSLLNVFVFKSGMMSLAIDVAFVLICIGLTAYDTQNIKQSYFMHGGVGETAGKIAVFGALSLYMNFVIIFINLLQLIGDRE